MNCRPCRSSRVLSRRRRGIAVLIVLGVLTVTLAVSYAIMRRQSTLSQLDRNASLSYQARQAARTGIEDIHGTPVHRLRGQLLPLTFLGSELSIHGWTPPDPLTTPR